jgi:hypothetical protein
MSVGLGLEIAKIVGTLLAAGVAGFQATDSVEGAMAAVGSALVGLFVEKPKHLLGK